MAQQTPEVLNAATVKRVDLIFREKTYSLASFCKILAFQPGFTEYDSFYDDSYQIALRAINSECFDYWADIDSGNRYASDMAWIVVQATGLDPFIFKEVYVVGNSQSPTDPFYFEILGNWTSGSQYNPALETIKRQGILLSRDQIILNGLEKPLLNRFKRLLIEE